MLRITALLLVLAVATAQTPSPQTAPDTVIRINVNLVQMDAVVTDSKDKPVTNLRAKDFEILQDGKPQAITNFAFVTTRPAGTRTDAAAAPKQAKGTPATPPPPPMALKTSAIRRTVALVVDDLGLSFESIARIRSALKKYVDQEMQPGDLVAVIRTGAGMGSLQQFTSDKRLLYAAIDRVKFNSLGRVGVSSFAPLEAVTENSIDTTSFDEEREQIFSAGTMGAIQYVVQGLTELPGRKSVILFSESMKLIFSDGMSERVRGSLTRLTDAANRASVVIHAIDPRGLQTLSLTAADNTSGRTAAQISQVSQQRSADMFESQTGMVTLAHETGGLFLSNTNDIDGALRRVVEDGEGYYLIGYHPDAGTFDAKTGQRKFHNVKVKVKVAGLHVRSRSGFFGATENTVAPVPHTRQGQIAHALTSPFGSGALHLRLTTLFSNAAQSGSFINSLLYFDPKELKFTDEPDGWHKAVIEYSRPRCPGPGAGSSGVLTERSQISGLGN